MGDRVRRLDAGTLGLVGLATAIGVWWSWHGAGYLLDDWFLLGTARIEGNLRAAEHSILVSRPGSAAIYTVVFGVLGGHPGAALAMASMVSGASALVFRNLLARFIPDPWAVTAAALWSLLPNHTALEYWLTCIPLSVAALLGLLALRLVADEPISGRRFAGAVALAVAASLTYEAVAPAVFLGLLLVPRFVSGWPSRSRVVAVSGVGAVVAGYLVAFRNPVKSTHGAAPLVDAFPGHLGWGIAPEGPVASALLVVGLVGLFIAVARTVLPSYSATLGERVAVAGLVVIAVGVAPFAYYFYAPLGAGDRFNLVSAYGGAMVWTGLAIAVWARRREVVVGVLGVMAAAGLVAREQRMSAYATAVDDGARIAAAIEARWPDGPPGGRVVLGPAPIQRLNVAAFLDASNVSGVLWLLYGDPDARGGVAFDETSFATVPAEQRLDIRPLSNLEPDTVIEP